MEPAGQSGGRWLRHNNLTQGGTNHPTSYSSISTTDTAITPVMLVSLEIFVKMHHIKAFMRHPVTERQCDNFLRFSKLVSEFNLTTELIFGVNICMVILQSSLAECKFSKKYMLLGCERSSNISSYSTFLQQ